MRFFAPATEFALAPGLRCRPFPVRHDGGPTFGFRIEVAGGLFGPAAALAYAADLGCWNDDTAAWISEVDLLAVEFNHDVHLERTSGRSAQLIARVLGDDGHLSNAQGAALVRAALDRSSPGRLRHLVQLHLSQECNRPILAQEAAQGVLREAAAAVSLHTAAQDQPGATLHVGECPQRLLPGPGSTPRPRRRSSRYVHPLLPGLLLDEA